MHGCLSVLGLVEISHSLPLKDVVRADRGDARVGSNSNPFYDGLGTAYVEETCMSFYGNTVLPATMTKAQFHIES